MRRIAVTDRREALLAAAMRVIAREGVAHASTRAIAAEAGMPVASFHYVFTSRDAMLHELVEGVVAGQRSAVASAVGDAEDLESFVRAALFGWLDRAVAAPEAEVVLHELRTWSRWAPEGDLGTAIYGHHEQTVLSVVEAATVRYGTRWAVPDAEVARLAIVFTDGVADRWLVDRDGGAAHRMLEQGVRAVLALAGADIEAVRA